MKVQFDKIPKAPLVEFDQFQRNTGDVGFVPSVELNSLLNIEVSLCVLAVFEQWNAGGKR